MQRFDYTTLRYRPTLRDYIRVALSRERIVLLIGIGMVVVLGYFAWFTMQFGPMGANVLIVSIPVALVTLYFVYRRLRIVVRVMKFCESNGIEYKNNVALDDSVYGGVIFTIGHSRKFIDSMKFEHQYIREIANYEYAVGYGRDKRYGHYGYVRIELPGTVPYMLLDAKSNNVLGITNLPQNEQGIRKTPLEGDFNEHFTLYIQEGYEVDARYIFTPDVMAVFMDSAAHFDCEMRGSVLQLYRNRQFDLEQSETYEDIFKVAESVVHSIESQAGRYVDGGGGFGK